MGDVKPITAVLAGTFDQFQNWMHETFRREEIVKARQGYVETEERIYRYVYDGPSLRGMVFDEFFTYGTFWEKRQAQELYDEMSQRVGMR